MRILIIGGTGTVGSQVVQELRTRQVDVRVLTRDPNKVKRLPPGVQGVVGDLLNPNIFDSIFTDVDGVFLLNAVSPTETQEGLMTLNGAHKAGIEHLVYLSVYKLEQVLHIPHLAAKFAIEAAIRAVGIP